MGIKHAFTTRNHHIPNSTVFLVNGPFSALKGSWHFRPLVRPGHEQVACKVEFDLRYSFSNRALAAVVSPVFDRVADTFVESFVRRAEAVHGPR
jgi:ribosome-associated toxin RatA of RatAB toxin-antitoxin module